MPLPTLRASAAHDMAFLTSTGARGGLHGQLRLARLLEMPERDFEERIREIEAKPLFKRLLKLGVVSYQPYPGTRFAERRFGGRALPTSCEGLSELVDGDSAMVRLIRRVGQERFEKFFLKDDGLSDEARAKACRLSAEEARGLREFIDRVYVQAEFESPKAAPARAQVFSPVAGIVIEGGTPVLGFFNREIWKGRYRVDEKKRAQLQGSLSPRETRDLEVILKRLEFLDHRKSTLYRVLNGLVEEQAEFLTTGEPERRRPLSQRAVASRLGILPSTLNRLISNKSVQLPWGLEAPIKVFVPSAKVILRDRFFDLALERPGLSDEELRGEVSRLFGAKLSRRSVTQYRKELGLAGRGKRAAGKPAVARRSS